MSQQQSNYGFCLTLMLVGALLVAVTLAPVLTLYISEKYASIETTASTTTIITTNTTTTTTSQIPTNQTYTCGNISPYTLWRTFLSNGIVMTINTSMCNFNSIPLYFTSVAGLSTHWILTGYGAIYSPSQTVFTVYARSPYYLNGTQLLSFSQLYEWNVNWFGLSN